MDAALNLGHFYDIKVIWHAPAEKHTPDYVLWGKITQHGIEISMLRYLCKICYIY